MGNVIMIFGLGDLGGHVLEFLVRIPNIGKIVAVDANEEAGIRKVNCALVGACQFNAYPEVEFVKLDVNDIDHTAATLKKYEPSIICNLMTLQSWWVITQLTQDAYKAIDEARYGPWFPMHFVLTYKLMKAVKKSGIRTQVINGAYPDLVNPVLAKLKLTPTVGIGNVDNIVPAIRIAVSKKFNVPIRCVMVLLIASHFVSYYSSRYGSSGGAPFYIKILIDDKNVTHKFKKDEVFSDMLNYVRRTGGNQGHPVVASSVVRIINGIYFDTDEIGHAPGPNGLPGGYPVRLNKDGVDIVLPEGLSLEEAIQINNEGNKFDGVERIEEDGTVVITEKSADIMKRLLGFDCKIYKIDEVEKKAEELGSLFKKYVEKVKGS